MAAWIFSDNRRCLKCIVNVFFIPRRMHRGNFAIRCGSFKMWEYEWGVMPLGDSGEFFQHCGDKYSYPSQHLTKSLFCKRHIEKMEMHAVGIFISCKQLWYFKRGITAASYLSNRFIISLFLVVFWGKWHTVLNSPRCQPLTKLGGGIHFIHWPSW